MTHVRTAPYYPQSNGKLERWHKLLKIECIRPGDAVDAGGCSVADPAVRGPLQYGALARCDWLHTPADMLAGRPEAIHAARDRKLEEARQERQKRRHKVT
jgi:transposase InsO family protein